jgi:uncharacterized membrane protein
MTPHGIVLVMTLYGIMIMIKIITIVFSILTIGSLWLTYKGTGLQKVETHSTLKSLRSTHYSSGYSSGGGFSSGK